MTGPPSIPLPWPWLVILSSITKFQFFWQVLVFLINVSLLFFVIDDISKLFCKLIRKMCCSSGNGGISDTARKVAAFREIFGLDNRASITLTSFIFREHKHNYAFVPSFAFSYGTSSKSRAFPHRRQFPPGMMQGPHREALWGMKEARSCSIKDLTEKLCGEWNRLARAEFLLLFLPNLQQGKLAYIQRTNEN